MFGICHAKLKNKNYILMSLSVINSKMLLSMNVFQEDIISDFEISNKKILSVGAILDEANYIFTEKNYKINIISIYDVNGKFNISW